MNSIAVVVLNWNRIVDTKSCVDALLEQTFSDFHVFVVDNGSSEKDTKLSLERLVEQHPDKISLLYNRTNLGFAGGVNVGIRAAIEQSYEHVALINNDAIPDKRWLAELHLAMQNKKVGIVTGLLLDEAGEMVDSTGEQYSVWGLPFPRNRSDKLVDAPKSGYTFGATGGASLYRSSLFNQIGLFDESLFAYYEDVDISFRAQLFSWKVYYTADAIAYHKRGASSNNIPGFTVYQTFKNLPLILVKNVPRGLLFKISRRFIVAYTLMFLKTIRSRTVFYALKGMLRSMSLLPKKMKERSHIQKYKTASSADIESILWDDLPPLQKGLRRLFRKQV